mmetsp:Transcript_1983/g.4501  ORF Transcript_1983/g.4501 Transcript_1983/m.4501 type:complete len:231 (+) Transcript_1983:119-811(+)
MRFLFQRGDGCLKTGDVRFQNLQRVVDVRLALLTEGLGTHARCRGGNGAGFKRPVRDRARGRGSNAGACSSPHTGEEGGVKRKEVEVAHSCLNLIRENERDESSDKCGGFRARVHFANVQVRKRANRPDSTASLVEQVEAGTRQITRKTRTGVRVLHRRRHHRRNVRGSNPSRVALLGDEPFAFSVLQGEFRQVVGVAVTRVEVTDGVSACGDLTTNAIRALNPVICIAR